MEAGAETQLSGIYVAHLERVIGVLREKYPRALAANRRFEEETGFENKLGMNNLADALSHIGTLVTEGSRGGPGSGRPRPPTPAVDLPLEVAPGTRVHREDYVRAPGEGSERPRDAREPGGASTFDGRCNVTST